LPAAAQEGEMQDVTLYYSTGNEFVTLAPNETQGESWSYGPSLMVLSQNVGVWRTKPLAKSLHITGSIDTVFWASGSGIIYFEIRVLVNGESTGLTLTSGSIPLGSSPQEYTSSDTGADLQLAPGDVFEIDVSIYLLGSNVNIFWGSSEHPSNVKITCDPIEMETLGYVMDPGSEKVTVNVTILSAFGPDDIANYSIQFQGPSEAEHVHEQEPEMDNGSLALYWVWEYGKDKTQNGEEYTILITVLDNSGNSYSSITSEPIKLEFSQGGGVSGNILIGVVLIIFVVVAFMILRKRNMKLNIFKSK
jgi:hypothetical protein